MKQFDDENIRREGEEAGAIADMGDRAEIGVRRGPITRLYTELAGAAVDHAHPANPYFQGRWARSLHVVSTDIARLQREGVVPNSVDPHHAARAILAAWEGFQYQWLHGPEFDIRHELEATICDVLRISTVPAPDRGNSA